MNPAENSVAGRELSMQLQLAGDSPAVTREQAEIGIAAARSDVASGRGRGYGLGFGFVRSLGSPNGLDGLRVEFAVTDGQRVANVHVVVTGTQLATLGKQGWSEPDADIANWMLERLYKKAGAIARDSDRYATLLSEAHPIHL